jgi:hypothetical protein
VSTLKTPISSTIIGAAKANSSTGLALMSYFNFDFRDSAKQDIRGLLTSILAQLSAKSDGCCDISSLGDIQCMTLDPSSLVFECLSNV